MFVILRSCSLCTTFSVRHNALVSHSELTFLHDFTAKLAGFLEAYRVVFCCFDAVHSLHNFLKAIMDIYSVKSVNHFCTTPKLGLAL